MTLKKIKAQKEMTRIIENLSQDLGVSFIEACQILQGLAAKRGDEFLIALIHELKMKHL